MSHGSTGAWRRGPHRSPVPHRSCPLRAKQRLLTVCGIFLWCASVAPAHAALVTLSGTQFDLTYDTTKLGSFGAPSLVGNTLTFTLNTFAAESLNGAGAVTKNSTVSGLVLNAKSGFQFGAFDLVEFGDYTLSGSGSFVRVQGQMRAFNTGQALTTQTSANLVVNPLTPLTLNDGNNHDWSASARIDASTPTALPSLFNVINSNPSEVGLTLENRLLAYTDPSGSGFRQAFIEKKFVGVGVQVTVLPAAVPLPPSAALTIAGLAAIALLAHRRNRSE